MPISARDGLRTGVVFATALAFIVLIGLNMALSPMLAGLVGAAGTSRSAAGMALLLALAGAWCGAQAAPERRPDSWAQAAAGALAGGLSAGLLYGVFVAALGAVQVRGIVVRQYLYQLSPENMALVQLGRQPPGGALASGAVIAAAAIAGAVLARGVWRGAVGHGARRAYGELAERWRRSTAMTRLAQHPNSWGVAAALGLGLVIVVPRYLGEYWNNTLGTVGIYMLMGLGLNIVVGLAGLLDLGYVAFFAVGAYTVGLLTAPQPLGIGLSFWLVLPIAVAAAALTGVLLGIPVLRLRGDYLAIVTLGFGEIVRVLIMSQLLAPILGGPKGIRDIAGPVLLGHHLTSQRAYVYLIVAGIALVIALTVRLQGSRLGRSWMALREDETVARATGINIYVAKLLAFAIGAAFAGLGGALFASRNHYTGPEDHVLMVSINVLCLVIVGGMGSIPGIVAGAFVLKGLPEVLRPLQDYRLLAFGALLVVMMIVRPQGIWPSRRRRLELRPDREGPSGAERPDPDGLPP